MMSELLTVAEFEELDPGTVVVSINDEVRYARDVADRDVRPHRADGFMAWSEWPSGVHLSNTVLRLLDAYSDKRAEVEDVNSDR